MIRWNRKDQTNANDAANAAAVNKPDRVSGFSGGQPTAPPATGVDYVNSLAGGMGPVGSGGTVTADPTLPNGRETMGVDTGTGYSDITPQPGFGPAEPITPDGVGFQNAPDGAGIRADADNGLGAVAGADDTASTARETAPQNAAPAPRAEPILPAHLDLDQVEIPHIDVETHFGERIESMIAAATIESENVRQDAKAQAKQIHDDAYADADRLVAAAKRQAAEIVTGAQQRAHEQLESAEALRAQAQTELDAAHREAEDVRDRAHEHADKVRSEGDAHVRDIIARAHADTAEQLHEARQELIALSERKVELEEQMSALRAILEETALHTTEIPLVPFDGTYVATGSTTDYGDSGLITGSGDGAVGTDGGFVGGGFVGADPGGILAGSGGFADGSGGFTGNTDLDDILGLGHFTLPDHPSPDGS